MCTKELFNCLLESLIENSEEGKEEIVKRYECGDISKFELELIKLRANLVKLSTKVDRLLV